MKVYGSLFDPLRPDRSTQAVPSAPSSSPNGAPGPVEPVAPVSPRSDSVEISSHGRTLARGLDAEMDPERVAELRRKAYQGAYNSLDVVDQVARRILTRGDL